MWISCKPIWVFNSTIYISGIGTRFAIIITTTTLRIITEIVNSFFFRGWNINQHIQLGPYHHQIHSINTRYLLVEFAERLCVNAVG